LHAEFLQVFFIRDRGAGVPSQAFQELAGQGAVVHGDVLDVAFLERRFADEAARHVAVERVEAFAQVEGMPHGEDPGPGRDDPLRVPSIAGGGGKLIQHGLKGVAEVAEKTQTSRVDHLHDGHEDVMAFMERLLQYAYQRVKEVHGEEIQRLLNRELEVPVVPFPRISMAEAIQVLKAGGYSLPPEKKGDIDPAGERALGDHIKEKYNHDFVFLTDWPIGVRPFYHMRHPDDQNLTRSFDLIASGLEISTGAQREHRYDVLAQQAQEKGLNLEPIQNYLNFFRYGCPPHGGFGLGLSRLLMVMLGLPNVREAVLLFRGPTRLNP